MKVLGIESSCDETAAAVVGAEGLLSDIIHSQTVHEQYGGVVPEVASRAHAENIVATCRAALAGAGIVRPDAVAATSGPGLLGAVLVGHCFAKASAIAWGVPFIGINHLEGHLLAPLLDAPDLEWPWISLLVSGGHTTLYLAEGLGKYRVLGETIDDAAGEAFDKVARVCGLGYPGGPAIEALARHGDAGRFSLPRPLRGQLNLSFSGLKTAVIQLAAREPDANKADIAAAFQDAVVDVLVSRVVRAAAETGVRRVTIGGGVAANTALREALRQTDLELYLPPRARCTDNAAMIALAGRLRLLAGESSALDLTARARWTPSELLPP